MKMTKWTLYCETEEAEVSVWSTAQPTECPNDAGHTITASSIRNGFIADSEFYMNDGTDVYKIEVNGTGDGFTFTKLT